MPKFLVRSGDLDCEVKALTATIAFAIAVNKYKPKTIGHLVSIQRTKRPDQEEYFFSGVALLNKLGLNSALK